MGGRPPLSSTRSGVARDAVSSSASTRPHCPNKLGLEITSYDKLPDDAANPKQNRLYYQTSLRGFSNQVHRYPPQGFADRERRALVEYLKTLRWQAPSTPRFSEKSTA
jgi:hypothetical protein